MSPLSRRAFLLGSAATLAIAACGSDSSSNSDTGADSEGRGGTGNDDLGIGGGTTPGEIVLVRRFAPNTLVTGQQRVPVVLGNINGLLPREDTPTSLAARLLDPEGKVALDSITAERHGEELEQPYFPFFLELATPGNYELQLIDTPDATAVVDVLAPADVAIPRVGDPLPPFETPTVDDNRGVNPVCTRDPACSLHDVTLAQALGSAKAVAYLIGTPAYCKTAVCGPVLDLLLDEQERRPDVVMVHAEVYTDDTIEQVAPAVTAYKMSFEPALFVADAGGTIVARLDAIYDARELTAALDLATA